MTSEAIRGRDHSPQTLAAWLADQDVSAFSRVDAQLADTTAFMRERGLVHFDAHFLNILTDGHGLYFSDFGLALSDQFDLSDRERAFLREHRFNDFHQSLMEHSKQTPYPRAELERIRARAGQICDRPGWRSSR